VGVRLGGGKPFDAAHAAGGFIHGVLNHSVLEPQRNRYRRTSTGTCWPIDLPGHCRSEDEAPSCVRTLVRAALLDATGVQLPHGQPQLGFADCAGSCVQT
jgi:hypothetical protein